ncbi:phage tail family protein [Paenibacillus sp. J5C_2022]|uniref:phage tail family protein n=1 Tax=Paenibacillus sp. J5C2022 TaxID=2977129 RepID=UPI0021D2CBD1|nr:phage tail family protein [Paenibacillus sp. J5C2022]MCU6709365.1 phage tail family protein [Paenibacillus sp. J5C2022]
MFNQHGFNEVPFNRPYVIDILFAVTMGGEGSMHAAASALYTASIEMSGEGAMTAELLREITAATFMSGEGTLSTQLARDRVASVLMAGEGTLIARPSKFRVSSITVDGPFGPGDKVVIDNGRLRVLKNGEYTSYDGDFFDLHPGINTLTYTDSEGGRTVNVRVTWRDRYL